MAFRVRYSSILRALATPRSVTNSACSFRRTSFALPPSIFNHCRYIQNLATPTKAKPTEKIIYGVEEDPDDLLTQEAQKAFSAAPEGNRTSYPTVSYDGSVKTINCSSESQRQAVFVDRTVSFTLSTTAIDGPGEQIDLAAMRRSKSESPQGASLRAIDITAMRRRSQSESPWGPSQKAQDKQFPQLKLNHIAPNFHALSSHGPIELYEYLSTHPEPYNPDETTKATANATDGATKGGSWVVFFSYPMDSTLACTTEVASMAELQGEFAKRGAKLLGLTIGTVEQHRDWMREIRKFIEAGGTHRGRPLGKAKVAAIGQPGTAQSVLGGGYGGVVSVETTLSAGGLGALDEEKEMGIEDVVRSRSIRVVAEGAAESTSEGGEEKNLLNFPIIADEDGYVSQLYGMLEDPGEATEVGPSTGERRLEHLRTVRSLFVIDPNRHIRLITAYPDTTGGDTAEILRALDALKRSDQAGVLTPEGWTVGDEIVVPPEMTHEDAEKKFGKGR